MTVLEAIQKSTEFLAKKGVVSPRLQSDPFQCTIAEICACSGQVRTSALAALAGRFILPRHGG